MSNGRAQSPGGPNSFPLGLPAASSLLSSRWSKDNLITSHPGRLYDGAIVSRVEREHLGPIISGLRTPNRPSSIAAVQKGVLTWNIHYDDDGSSLVMQIPRALDEPGRRGRAKCDVPHHTFQNASYFISHGLTRFAPKPVTCTASNDAIRVAVFADWNNYHPIALRRGAVQIERYEGTQAWGVSLGDTATATLLVEMVAALVYHYEPEADGGTAVTDVFINDGDFVVRRREDGSFDVRMTALRRREGGISPNLLLLYLVQLMTYEDWAVGDDLVGLPVVASNPTVAFEGLVRGLRYRYRDLDRDENEGRNQATRWLEEFAYSAEGHAYRPWVERFLRGELPVSFGHDLREHWWRLTALQQKCRLLQLRHRAAPSTASSDASSDIAELLQRLAGEIGNAPARDASRIQVNDLDEVGLQQLLTEARVPSRSRTALSRQILRHWPHRRLDSLLAKVPAAKDLRRIARRLDFGRVTSSDTEGTVASLGEPASGVARELANDERFGAQLPSDELQEQAVQRFCSFEHYMDTALHDPRWGYYAHRVEFGRAGHFTTNPEALSPRYGGWLATLALKMWTEMVAHSELREDDPFVVVEFGAGNARLARDFIDAVRERATSGQNWQRFASVLQYRIYERSESLRQTQRALLGDDATVLEGDARRPAVTLRRDFADGVRGLILTNEVPDAFGVHKVLLSQHGQALATLVVPRIGAQLRSALPRELAKAVTDVDQRLRAQFDFDRNPGECYVDDALYERVMGSVCTLAPERRTELLLHLWFEELYVPVAMVEGVNEHLALHAGQYARALAAEPSGVVCYLNLHASRFIHELGESLTAGYVVTIDYGGTTRGIIDGARRGEFPFRVYGQWDDYVPRPNDPYAVPGSQDLTADVNFTELADTGARVGLKVAHFGPERDLVGDDLPGLVDQSTNESMAEFLGNPVFKVLVQSTRDSRVMDSALASPTSLHCDDLDVPESRRALIVSIERALRGSP